MAGSRGLARRRRLVAVGTVAALGLAGCTGTPEPDPPLPADLSNAPMPPGLTTMADQTPAVIELVRHREWGAASTAAQRVDSAWTSVASDRRYRVNRALHQLEAAIGRRDVRSATLAAITLQQDTLDLEVSYRPIVEVDTERFRVWASRLELDAAVGDLAAVSRDVATLSRLRDRIGQAVPEDRMARAGREIGVLREAVADGELGRVREASQRLAEGW